MAYEEPKSLERLLNEAIQSGGITHSYIDLNRFAELGLSGVVRGEVFPVDLTDHPTVTKFMPSFGSVIMRQLGHQEANLWELIRYAAHDWDRKIRVVAEGGPLPAGPRHPFGGSHSYSAMLSSKPDGRRLLQLVASVPIGRFCLLGVRL